MNVQIMEESAAELDEYAAIPISFEVRELLDIDAADGGAYGASLDTRPLARPFLKDYDAAPGNGPLEWGRRFDLTHWGIFAARAGGTRVGGAAVAFPAHAPHIEAHRAVLWDLRVAPDARRQGVGSALLRHAEAWAHRRGAHWIAVETQNINVPAYRFYTSSGFELASISAGVYPDYPDEVQLWLEKRLFAAV